MTTGDVGRAPSAYSYKNDNGLQLDDIGGVDVRNGLELFEVFFGEAFIQRQYHQGHAARFETGDVHGADIDISRAGDAAHRAQQAGAVLMVAEEEIAAGGHDIRGVAVDQDDMGLAADDGAGHGGNPLVGRRFHGNLAGIEITGGAGLFGDLDAAPSGNDVGVDHV